MKTFELDKKSGLLRVNHVKTSAPLAKRSFAAAKSGPQLEDWKTSQSDINTEVQGGNQRMRNRARALEQDNSYFGQWLRELEANVLGDEGIKLKIDAPDNIAIPVEEAWKEFSQKNNFSASRTLNRLELGKLILKSIGRDGDCLVEIHRDFPKNRFGIAFSAVEGDYLSYDANDAKRNIVMGVERDQWDEPTAYWRYRQHPGNQLRGGSPFKSTMASRVAAESPGEINVGRTALMPFLRRRLGQVRGYSWASAAIKMLHQLESWEEASVINKRVKSAKMGFFGGAEDDPEGMETDENGNLVIDLEPGSFHDIGSRTFTPFAPADIDDYEGFRKGILRGAATALGISYAGTLFGNDLNGVNFSSIRQGVLSEREMWKILQSWWIAEVEGPLFYAWLESSMLNGSIPIPFSSINDIKPMFQGRRWTWVDPLKDVKASVEAVNNNLSSTQRENRKLGQDPREIAKEKEEDEALFGKPEEEGEAESDEQPAEDSDE